MKLSPAMEDALRFGRVLNDGTIIEGFWTNLRTSRALVKRGLSDGFRLTTAGIAERERLLK